MITKVACRGYVPGRGGTCVPGRLRLWEVRRRLPERRGQVRSKGRGEAVPQGNREDSGIDVHCLGEALTTPDLRALPQDVLGIRFCVAAVRAGGGVQVCLCLVRRCPCGTSRHVLENTLSLFVQAGDRSSSDSEEVCPLPRDGARLWL